VSAHDPHAAPPRIPDPEVGYRSLFEHNPDAIFTLSLVPRLQLTSANPAAERISGYSADELRSITARQLIAPDDFDRTAQHFVRAVSGQPSTDEIAILRKDGRPVDVSFTLVPVLQDGVVTGVYGIGRDISERRRAERERDELLAKEQAARERAVAAEERATFLAEAGRLLSSSLDYEATLAQVAHLAVPRLADWCAIDVATDGGVRRLVGIGSGDEMLRARFLELQRRYPLDSDDPLTVRFMTRAIRLGRTDFVPDVRPEHLALLAREPEHLELLKSLGISSLMRLPLTAHDQHLGALTFVCAGSQRHFTEADLALAEELAGRAAIAIENTRLYAAEQQARQVAEAAAERTGRLQAVTASLSEAATPEQVAAVVVEQGVSALGAQAGSLAALEPDDDVLTLLGAVGYAERTLQAWHHIPLDAGMPMSEAARSGEFIWLDSLEERLARFPALSAYTGNFRGSMGVIPLAVEGRVVGVMGLSFDEPRALADADRDFMLTLARECALALERARLYAAAQQARAEAEAAEHQVRHVQSVSDVALSTLRLDDLLHELLDRIAAILSADTALLFLLDEGRQILEVRATCGILRIDEEMQRDLQVAVGEGFAGRVAAERRPVVLESVGDQDVASPRLRAAGLRSLVGVPLLAQDRLIGVLHIGSLSPRRFAAGDIDLLQLAADRAALALDNARLYQEAQRAVEVRDQFLAAASHDLRTPVTTIKAHVQLLQRNLTKTGFDPIPVQDGLGSIERAAGRITAQINELLDLSRLQSGRPLELDRRPTNLVALARQVAATHEQISGRHRITVESPVPELVGYWDPVRLERVLANLLSNAIKYSPQGGPIVLHLRRGPCPEPAAGRECAELEVVDHGIGIPAADLPHIFERFYRARNVQGRPGTGIGLAGSREIVQQHGGRLEAASEEGRGSTFTLSLPLAVPEESELQ
jgi:PAS domain S-box-containing protein